MLRLARTPACIALLTAIASGCSLRPQPEPPPVPPGPEINADLLTAFPNGPAALAAGTIEGAPGAVPPGAVVRVYNLERPVPNSETVADLDGSFSLELDSTEGDEVRLQAITDENRSRPLDVIIQSVGQTPVPAERALGTCLSVAPTQELAFDTVATGGLVERTILVANGCAFPIVVSSANMRAPIDGLSLTPDAIVPRTVPPGTSMTIDVRYAAPQTEGEVEDVALILIDTPVWDRRPVTIHADVRSP